MRYLGLDLGTKTLVIAVSDLTGTIATSLTILRHENNHEYLIEELKKIISEKSVETIVLGFPKNMNNTIGERAQKSEAFAEMLRRRTNLEVILWDERLTTVAAHQVLDEANVNLEKKARVVDKIASVFILQGYLDYLYMKKEEQ